MFPIGKGAPATTQPIEPVAAGAWDGMRQAQPENIFQNVKYAVQNHRDKIASLSPEKKKQLENFNKMAMSQPKPTQFSPVSFSGGANSGSLSMLVEELKKRGMV